MKILSFGAGMQSTALALMACENAKNPETPWPLVPAYDVVIFCDLGMEPPWVKDQVEFTRKACEWAGIKFVVLDSPLYSDFMRNSGSGAPSAYRGGRSGMTATSRKCRGTAPLTTRVELISKYVRWELLHYKKGQRLRDEDRKAHEMHMGFSAEESRRCKESPNPMFVNKFPLVEMGLTRARQLCLHQGRLGPGDQGFGLYLLPLPPQSVLFLPEEGGAGGVWPPPEG